MDETSKARTRREAEGFYDRYIRGRGLDIGCGKDKIVPEAVGYDIDQGDAQHLRDLNDETFDYVYSSHCLEHVRDPLEALLNWWRVLKPGGHLIVAVPDEDLYEQGIVPSVFNPDHKVTFTISKEKSWSPVSRNLVDLIRHLPRHKVISLRTTDSGYDYDKLGSGEDQTLGDAEAAIEVVVQKVKEELPLRSHLQKLLLCPNCERLEFTALGWDATGHLRLSCRSCGGPGEVVLAARTKDPETAASNGTATEARDAGESEARVSDLLQKALGHFKGQELGPARSLCDEILELEPDHPDALHLQGGIAIQQGDRDFGVESLLRSVEVAPSRADFHMNLSQVLLEGGEGVKALFHLRRAHEIDPRNFLVLHHLGVALQRSGETEEALDALHRALRIRLDHSRTWLSIGKAHLGDERLDEAILALRIAVNIDPDHDADHPEGWFHLGRALEEKGDLEAAEAAYRSVLQSRPRSLEALHALGGVLKRQWKNEEGIDAYKKVLEIDAEHVPSLIGLGAIHHQSGQISRAEECWEKALSIDPECDLAKLGLSVLALMRQDFRRGWPLYESRLRDTFHSKAVCRVRSKLAASSRAEWKGEPLAGKTILVYTEQGYGDAIQFVRYLPLLHDLGARVLFGAPPVLETLLRMSELKAEIVSPGVSLESLSFDYFSALLSLPYRLGTNLSNLPCPGRYLRPDTEKVARYRSDWFDHEDLKIGITWQGNPHHPLDRIRSIPLSSFSPLWALTGARIYSLQKGPGRDQVSSMPAIERPHDLGSSFEDFSDTAAAIENLDLVICADTAVAHLAGALGKETWILLPTVTDWRWFLKRPDSPWYPSVRLFRQTKSGDYESVFGEVLAELKGEWYVSSGKRVSATGSSIVSRNPNR